uniref:Uncharacterized protein n=1 Tax=Caenorhabditis japonica TaxID=281687 RepID=A0A8R1DYN0_CAEJA
MSGRNKHRDAETEKTPPDVETDFPLSGYDICPGNLEIFEKYYPDIDWHLTFRTNSHLFGKKLTKDHLNTFTLYTQEYKAYKEKIEDWSEKEKKSDENLERIREGAIQQAERIEKMFEKMKEVSELISKKEEALALREVDSDDDDCVDEEEYRAKLIPEINEYYERSRVVTRNVADAELKKEVYEAAKRILEKLHDDKPEVPAFMTEAFERENQKLEEEWERAKLLAGDQTAILAFEEEQESESTDPAENNSEVSKKGKNKKKKKKNNKKNKKKK